MNEDVPALRHLQNVASAFCTALGTAPDCKDRPTAAAAGSAGAMKMAAIVCCRSIHFYVKKNNGFYELFAIFIVQLHSDFYFPSSF
jgi:hypothetical protein